MDEVTNGVQENAPAADPAAAPAAAPVATPAAAPEADPAATPAAAPEADPAAAPAAAPEADPAADPTAAEQQKTADSKAAEDIAAEQQKKTEELDQREKDLNRRELEMEVRGILSEKSISEGMLPFLLRDSREETLKCIDAYKKAADEDLKTRLDAVMVGNPPKGNTGSVTSGDKTNAAVFASALRG